MEEDMLLNAMDDIIAKLKSIQPHLKAIVQSIEAIESEQDAEVVTFYIEMMQRELDVINGIFDIHDEETARQMIRDGVGDYGRITKKCIGMGVV